jgi:hypothetical protein
MRRRSGRITVAFHPIGFVFAKIFVRDVPLTTSIISISHILYVNNLFATASCCFGIAGNSEPAIFRRRAKLPNEIKSQLAIPQTGGAPDRRPDLRRQSTMAARKCLSRLGTPARFFHDGVGFLCARSAIRFLADATGATDMPQYSAIRRRLSGMYTLCSRAQPLYSVSSFIALRRLWFS